MFVNDTVRTAAPNSEVFVLPSLAIIAECVVHVKSLLSTEQVLERCPGIPLRFINLLPWTRTRTSPVHLRLWRALQA